MVATVLSPRVSSCRPYILLIYEPLSAGCFGHYATLGQHDANFSRHERANEWLVAFDSFSSAMYSDGDFALNQYLPYTLVPFYPLFQERGGDRVERNQADWDVSPTIRKAVLLADSRITESAVNTKQRGGIQITFPVSAKRHCSAWG